MNKINVLVVDDSALMRKKMTQILESDPSISVIATARNGEDAILKARELRPDVITLDINMPVMDGITALRYIVEEELASVVMVSSLTQDGADVTIEALEIGAFDYVPKPGGTVSLNLERASEEIIEKVKEAAKFKNRPKRRKRLTHRIQSQKRKECKIDTDVKIAVAIGISTGGPKTLLDVIPFLPEDLGATVFIVQHMPPNFTASFAKRLDNNCKFPIKEAEAGDIISVNHGYLGKGGYHLIPRKRSDGKIMLRLPTTPQHLFIPSVDVMMEAVLEIFGDRTVGVLMTGMGDDGADAMVKIRKAGGITIAESEETAIVFGMPKEAIERGGAEIVVPSYEIADEIVKAVKKIKYKI